MKYFLVLIVVGIFIKVIFPAHLFGQLDFINAIQGYHLMENYQVRTISELSPVLLSGVPVVQIINFDSKTSILEVSVFRDFINKTEYKFIIGDNVAVYFNIIRLENPHVNGRIIDFVEYNAMNNSPFNTSQLKMKILINTDVIEEKSIYSLINDKDNRGISVSFSIKNGFNKGVYEYAIRSIKKKKYLCVVTKELSQKGFWETRAKLVKFKLKEIQTGGDIYHIADAGPLNESIIEVISGINPDEKIIISKLKHGSGRTNRFYCGRP